MKAILVLKMIGARAAWTNRIVLLCLVLVFTSTFSFPSSAVAQQEVSDGKRIRIDVGGSTGKRGDDTYTEANVGVSYLFSRNLIWRNSVWGRFQTETKDVYGLDTALRGVLEFGDSQAGLNLFVAPGYRFVSDGATDPAPFAEGGLTLRAGGINIGGGVKTIFNEVVHNGIENETQYFVTLGGGLNL